MSDPIEILDYWLGEVGAQGWYAGGAALDADIRDRFLDVWTAAHEGGLEHWVDGTVGTLAYLILCDQLARNMHRGQADAFVTDARALAAAKRAVAEGWDLDAPEPERQFFYYHTMPPGLGVCLTTYQSDGSPLEAYRGEPMYLPLRGGLADVAEQTNRQLSFYYLQKPSSL